MVVVSLAGAALLGAARYGYTRTAEYRFKSCLKAVINTCDIGMERRDGKMIFAKVRRMIRRRNAMRATVELPVGYAASKFEKFSEVIEQTAGVPIRVKRSNNRLVYVDFGTAELAEVMPWKSGLVLEKAPIVPLFTPFGLHVINFWDEASTHLLVGGATRMGKSVLIRLLVTCIYDQLVGAVRFVLIDNKIEDLFPFDGVENIVCAETAAEAERELLLARAEVAERRKKLKRSKCANMKQYREKHPEDAVPPLFVVVDEFGRFAEDDNIQNLIVELAETAGSYDVHLVIASQRPDAQTVLRPRLRANLLTRIAFTTADEANSNIIIGSPDAAHLGGVKGRAVLLDGLLTPVQVPFISEQQVMAILDRYRVDIASERGFHSVDTPKPDKAPVPRFVAEEERRIGGTLGGDHEDGVEQTRRTDFEVPGAFPRFVSDSNRGAGLFGLIDQEPDADGEPGDETSGPRWSR